jgi:hypothetical protein
VTEIIHYSSFCALLVSLNVYSGMLWNIIQPLKIKLRRAGDIAQWLSTYLQCTRPYVRSPAKHTHTQTHTHTHTQREREREREKILSFAATWLSLLMIIRL